MSSKGKTFLVAGAIVAVIVLALGAATNWFSNWSKFSQTADDVKSWVTGGNSSSSSASPSSTTSPDGKVTLAAADTYIRRLQNEDGTFTHSSVKLTATVNSDASVKAIAWSFAWTDSAVSAVVTDYFSIVSQTDSTTGGYCYVSASRPYTGFGSVSVTARTVDDSTATAELNYYNSIDVFQSVGMDSDRNGGNWSYATGSSPDGTDGVYYYKESLPFTVDFAFTCETNGKTALPGWVTAGGYATIGATYTPAFYAQFQRVTNFDPGIFAVTSFGLSFNTLAGEWRGYFDVEPNSGSAAPFHPALTLDGKTKAFAASLAKYVAASNVAMTAPSLI